MKNLLSIVLVALTFFGCQTTRSTLTPIAGYTNSTVGGKDAESFDCRSGFHAGVLTLFDVTDKFGVRPGLIFSQQGADYSDEYFRGSYNLNYLNFPVLAVYNLGSGFSLVGGPQLGLLLSANDEYTIKGGMTMEEDAKDDLKGIDIGLNAGVNYQFNNGLLLRATYNFGLTEINDFEMPGNESWKNNVLQFSVGYTFDLGKGDKSDD